AGGPGPIYVRENPFAAGGECVGSGAPCTVAVSEAAEAEAGTTGTGSQFWAASADADGGGRALFSTGGCLYEFDLEEEETEKLACEAVRAPLGQSDDLSRVYFASREAKGGPNAEGKSAQPGEANLYLWEEGSFRFIGALAGGDVTETGISPVGVVPVTHSARVSGDGLTAAFTSQAQLTGYDNADAASEAPDAEVFVYDAAAEGGKGRLVCASCNPSGARPRGALVEVGFPEIQAAALIPVAENTLYSARALSEDGDRLYFEAYDSLSPRDSNGQTDVYQWEALDSGGCRESLPTYSPQNGGCVDLISSGKSVREATFLDADPSGDNVFFATLTSLLPQDPGLVDVYDARVGGGLPIPPVPPPPCDGEACQRPAAAPGAATPASETYEGPGNQAPRHKCAKGKHRVKGKCVKKKAHKGAKRHHRAKRGSRASGRAGR
ncbi:MAG TPA: hypothetical protein VG898_11815, partial [Solirubrobacterales bacterium]|nr:hypothetical protein [Solirubrobacterales bacterium]